MINTEPKPGLYAPVFKLAFIFLLTSHYGLAVATNRVVEPDVDNTKAAINNQNTTLQEPPSRPDLTVTNQEVEPRWIGQLQTRPNDIPSLELSTDDISWLERHPQIRLGVDASWEPLEYIDQKNRYQGLTSDYMSYFSQQLGVEFIAPQNIPWDRVLKGLQDKTIDLAPLIAETDNRSEYLVFTQPYLNFPNVIFNRRGESLPGGMSDLINKRVGMVKGYAISELVGKDYPDIEQVFFTNTSVGLQALAVGKIDAYIDVLGVGGYIIASQGLSNLQIASSTPYSYKFSMGVREDWPELTKILNKAIISLPAEKKNEFLKRWLVVSYEEKTDYTLLIWVLGISAVIVTLISLRSREMSRINAKLSESRERLSLTLDSADLGTWQMTFPKNNDPTFSWDETFAKHHDLPTQNILLKPEDFYQYLNPDYVENIKNNLERYIKGKNSFLRVEYLTKKNKRWISSRGRIFERDNRGWANRIVGVSQDISQHKEDQLAMEKSSQFKSQFLANMSHEIRTPMNAIVGLGHLLSRTEVTEKQADYINNLQKSAQSLLALIDDILDVSKIEAGHLNIEKIEFNLEELLNDLAQLSAVRISSKNIEIIYDMDAEVPTLLIGDSFRINQVLTNLISNAIKFTESGNIVLRISVSDNNTDQIWLLFEVSDTGIGIAPDKLEKLFDPFVQEDGSTTRKYGGTGLGLSISKQLTDLMGGQMGAESTQGKGSKFYFKLPFIQAKEFIGNKTSLRGPTPDLRGLRVLLVDDNPLSLKILAHTLESMSFNVTSVSSGKMALQLLEGSDANFDLVLLDWRMPEMDGAQAAMLIREVMPKNKLPIIIMMTAFGKEAAEQKINLLPLDGFLVKPITSSQFFDAIIQARQGMTRLDSDHEQPLIPDHVVIDTLVGNVLLAEDNYINQQVATEIIQQMGLTVTICVNGVQVLEAIKIQRPDIILMDIQMPEMDGYEATKIIRQNPEFLNLPIIAMTANAMAEDVEKSIEAGMNGHISKPVDPQILYQALRQHLDLEEEVLKTNVANTPTNTFKNWPDEIPGLNIKTGIKQVGGNEELYQKLIKDFLTNHGHQGEALKKSLDEGNIDKAVRIIHTLKGVSGNIGAYRLMSIASKIDKNFKLEKQISDELITTFNEACNELCGSIRQLINEETGQPDIPDNLPRVLENTDLRQLKSALEKGDAATIRLVQELSPTLKNLLGETGFTSLHDYVLDYEYELATQQLDLAMEKSTDE